MSRLRFAIASRLAAAAAASLAFVHSASAPEIGFAAPVRPQPTPALRLAVNPKLARQLPPAGWIADHSGSWVADHAAYREPCQSPLAIDELRFLNRIIGYDEYLIGVTQAYMTSAAAATDETGTKHADFAAARIDGLRSDIAIADGLATRLQALPACAADAPAAPGQPARLDQPKGMAG